MEYIQAALEFLQSHKDVAFATSEGNKPKIRVFQIMKQEGSVLYFATSPKKQVYQQLQQNPNIELLAMEGDISVRCVGKAEFDVSEETQKWIYDNNAVLSRLYPSYDAMVYFKMQIIELDYYNLQPTPPILKHYKIK